MTGSKGTFPFRTTGAGTVVASIGIAAANLPGAAGEPAAYTIAAGSTLVAAAVAKYAHSRKTTRGQIGLWSAKAIRNESTASWFDVQRTSSRRAMRKEGRKLRPAALSRSELREIRRYAKPVCKVGARSIWISCEETELILGATRMGKSEAAGSRVIDAPGAVIATSTRLDLIEMTAALRAQRGPVHIFNPSGLGGIATTVKFDILGGCRDISTAAFRADDLVEASSTGGPGSDVWQAQARRTLSVLLHAAALGDRTPQDVLSWVSNPDDHKATVYKLLARSTQPEAMTASAQGFFELHEGGKRSISMSTIPALSWLVDKTAASVAEPGADNAFDVEEFIKLGGTLYLLGSRKGNVGPLVAALTAHIWREAQRIAANNGGRLDPALTMVLDEAYLVCPVPLPEWCTEAGGWSIQLHIIAQSLAQLRQRWGDEGAEIILDNTNVLLAFGGIKSRRNLEDLSALSGIRQEETKTYDADGKLLSTSSRAVPVVSMDQLTNLGRGRVMVKRRGMPTALGRTTVTSKRRDVRAANAAAPRLIQATNFEAELLEEEEEL